MGLKRCKSLGLCGSPCEHFVLLGQIREGFCELRVIFDEAAIEVHETKEATDAVDIGRGRPFHNCFHLGIVHFDAIPVDEHSQILHLRFIKGAFLWACEQIVIAEPLENFLHLGLVLRQVALGEDHDVVNVDNDHVLHVGEDLVHHGLEGGRGVAKSEEHDSWLKGSAMTYKCSLPFISFLDTDVVVTPPEIDLREVLRSLEFVDELGDERERVVVPNRVFIQIPIILYHPFPTVFLWNKEYG